jgi:hypothetical protein
MKEIVLRITLRIEAPEGVEVVAVTTSEGSPPEEASSDPSPDPVPRILPPDIESMIESAAPPRKAEFEREYLLRCLQELSLSASPPKTGDRQYVNLLPREKKYGSKRAAVLDPKSGRVEIYCDPTDTAAENLQHAAPVLHKGVPVAIKVYLDSEEALGQAFFLTLVGLNERLAR